MFETFDFDNDGNISFMEFQIYVMSKKHLLKKKDNGEDRESREAILKCKKKFI